MALFLYHVNTKKYYIAKDSILIGRTTGHITVPEDSSMSGQHAELLVDRANSTIRVKDLNSKNHTIVDRIEIDEDSQQTMKLYSLLEVGAQKFFLFDNRSVPDEVIEDMLLEKMRIEITKVKAKKIVNDLRQRFQQEIDKLSATEQELTEKINNADSMKAEAQRIYMEKVREIDEQTAIMRTQVKDLVRKITDLKTRIEKHGEEKDSMTGMTRTVFKK